MAFTREINRLMFGLLIAFFFVVGSAAYWAIVGADSILLRGDNPRLVEAELAIDRGAIYDIQGRVLVETVTDTEADNSNAEVRRYYYPSMHSIVGYFSFRYGVGGAEAAYDAYLRGDVDIAPIEAYLERDLLHLPPQGADVRLTLDLDVQQAIATALGEYTGAAVVLSVPDGAVLGMLSAPTYDPNTLDEDWNTLIAAENDPFFNRALQGQYQPGGMLQTPLMVAGILTQQPFDIVTADANRPLLLDDRTLTCATEPPTPDLTYSQAYAYACPIPFSLLANDISPATLQNIIDSFQLNAQPTLEGFVITNTETEDSTKRSSLAELTPETTEIVPTPSPESTPDVAMTSVEDLVGQGSLTINPLNMATVAAAVINGGNAPQAYALSAYRPATTQAENAWLPVPQELPTQPLMTATAARRLRQLMIANTEIGATVSAARSDLTIGGHTALAISGDETQAWFIGFVTLAENQGIAIAVVLENTDQATEASRIGGEILESAANSLRNATNE